MKKPVDASKVNNQTKKLVDASKVNNQTKKLVGVSKANNKSKKKKKKEQSDKKASFSSWLLQQTLEDGILDDKTLLDIEYKPKRVRDEDVKSEIGLNFKCVVIPDCVWYRGAGDERHIMHEFTEWEADGLDLEYTPATLDHQMMPETKSSNEMIPAGRCIDYWMVDNSLHGLFEIFEDDSILTDITYGYLAQGLTLSVSLRHVCFYLSNANRFVRYPVEVSLCTIPRRTGADIYEIRLLSERARTYFEDNAVSERVKEMIVK